MIQTQPVMYLVEAPNIAHKAQMFEEMAVLVDAQGEMLDAIEVWMWNMLFLEWKTWSLMAGISGTNWKVKKQGKDVFLMSKDDGRW